ncbi:retrotransposon protein, putative, ty1-copia subclass [Tanacetum coccineum]
MGKTVGELHAMLIEYAKGLPKNTETPQVMMIKGDKIQKSNKKSLKAKGKGKANGKGHCKRNCLAYLAELIKKKKQVGNASSLDVFIIELFSFPTKSWVYDTICVFYGFGNSISNNSVFYFNVIPSNGIYEIDMHDLVPNVNSIYIVSNKRVKRNLDSAYLWHCRLAHINKKRIKQLQQDGLLKSTDDESFDKCESCLSSKMTKKPFPHSNEREKDHLGIIHTDVCGPLRHVSRQCASYFITFTDDYSRYGYVYLLKHKHEVFETFKVFKNEVENQLGNDIMGSSRQIEVGKYISQEFKDYLKACRIVQQLTPPYTPQHNDVSERRNHTLLDMVRSMMNLTTLPLSFWDYALESSTRILNMVPTKKVDKTPYELWYGKLPNLSYLKVWGCEALVKQDTPDKLQQRFVKCMLFEKNLITQEVSGRAIDLEEIQDKDTSPSEIISEIPMEVKGFEPPKEEEILICRILKSLQAFYDMDKANDIKMLSKMVILMKTFYMVQPEGFVDPNIQKNRSKRLIRLGQNAYMDKILKRYKMDNSKRGHIPMQERLDLNKTQGASTPEEFAQNITSRFQQNTGEPHWTAVKNILKIRLYFEWRRSRLEKLKQSTTAMSATEAEYIAASEAAMEAVWIRKFISGLGIVPTINEPIKMFCDNSAALHFANEPGVQKGARHYHRRYHYVRESIELGEIKFLKVYTDTIWLILLRRLYLKESLLNMLGAWDFV